MPHALTCDKCDVSEYRADLSTLISVHGNPILVCPSCRVIEHQKLDDALAEPAIAKAEGK